MSLAEPQVHRWTRNEYYKMADVGFFSGRHVELIEGKVVEMGPMGSLHRTSVTLSSEALRSVFGKGYFISTQCPIDFGEYSEPEPDAAVIKGKIRDYKHNHPKTAVLIVEAADTSLEYDRTEKASLYARAGIADYWVVNLIDRQLEVFRCPVVDKSKVYGFDYSDVTIITESEYVTPLALGRVKIAVADLLP